MSCCYLATFEEALPYTSHPPSMLAISGFSTCKLYYVYTYIGIMNQHPSEAHEHGM